MNCYVIAIEYKIDILPAFVSYRRKSIISISSKLMYTVGLLIKINDFAKGYNRPSFAFNAHRTA